MKRRRFVSLLAGALAGVSSLAAQERQENLPIVPLVLTNHGFEQTEISVRNGRARLIIHNHSGREEVDLRVERVVGPQRTNRTTLKQANVPLRRRKWNDAIDFTPGTFIVSVTGTAWECNITVAP